MMMYDASKKSIIVAYLFWFLLGWLAVHRFYLGKRASAIAMLSIWCIALVLGPQTNFQSIVLGALLVSAWWLIDALLIPGMVGAYHRKVIAALKR
jgi:TM2 domain-containing membrane protein YozV